MQKHKTDKAEHRFDIPYSFFFDERRHEVKAVLEIGIKRGASLRVWEEYFPNATILGIDINPKYATSASERSRVFIGDQTDRDVLRQISTAADARFDLIIDDGSHMSDDQVATLSYLWPFLKPTYGIYAIEDLHAHVKFPQHYGHQDCRHPPMSDMLVRLAERRLVEESCASGSPGICVYGAMAILLKGEDGAVPDFDDFLKPAGAGS